MPYTSLNGHMFSFLTPEGLPALRLSEAQPEDLIRKKQATQTIQHGRVMQEFVDISAALWKTKLWSLGSLMIAFNTRRP